MPLIDIETNTRIDPEHRAKLLDDVLGIPKERTFDVFDEVPRDRWGVTGALLG